MTKQISYIIPFRAANKERVIALLFIVKKLRSFFPEMEIIVVEQDRVSKLDFELHLNIKHIFVQNTGHFNKCWAFNVGVEHTNKAIFVFGDSDIFISKKDYITCFGAVSKFEAITPNKVEALNIVISDKADTEYELLNKRPLFTFAGGILLLTRAALRKLGGWDERFEGWGGEDDAMSHLIYNKLSSKSFHFPFYHIDHPRTKADGNQQQKYLDNRSLADEIKTLAGKALDRYIETLANRKKGILNKYAKGKPSISDTKKPKLVLAITTYNRLDYLKDCVSSFLRTKSSAFEWQILIADDGSTDGTKIYLDELQANHKAILIHNNRVDIHRQVNTILKALSDMDFDICFKCDDDIVFKAAGWDDLYSKTITRTGYQHLVFYDKNWQPYANLARPIKHGNLVANCAAEAIQGGFYTITPAIIEAVGYFDEQQFGRRGLGHVDYTLRCCRAGFNVLAHPFDVESSNELLQLQVAHAYRRSVSSKYKALFNSKEIIELKKQITQAQRIYIPYNENFQSLTDQIELNESDIISQTRKKSITTKYHRADATFYPERGISGFFGFVLKRFYNLSLDLGLTFIPFLLKGMGRGLNKISLHLMNIED